MMYLYKGIESLLTVHSVELLGTPEFSLFHFLAFLNESLRIVFISYFVNHGEKYPQPPLPSLPNFDLCIALKIYLLGTLALLLIYLLTCSVFIY